MNPADERPSLFAKRNIFLRWFGWVQILAVARNKPFPCGTVPKRPFPKCSFNWFSIWNKIWFCAVLRVKWPPEWVSFEKKINGEGSWNFCFSYMMIELLEGKYISYLGLVACPMVSEAHFLAVFRFTLSVPDQSKL